MGIGGGSRRPLAAWLLGILFLLAAPFAAGAADGDWDAKIKIHGFLSQAWAKTDGEQYLGITEDGTTDYRNLALQLRFQVADNQSLVFQLGHETRGKSPRDAFRDEVELDWAFYEAHFGNASVRVGRIPLPLGIYSELRDAGHLLPFYGPPITIYGETSFASDAIDGASMSFNFFGDSPWNLDLDVFGGQSTFSERIRSTGGFQLADTSHDWGIRAWLSTPVEGLRIGLNHHSFETDNSKVLKNEVAQVTNYLSFDWSRDRFLVRSELGRSEVVLPYADVEAEQGYVMVGASPLPKLWVYLQGERRHTALTPRITPDRTSHEMVAIGLTYGINERTVIKLEHQDMTTNEVDRIVGSTELVDVKATILSLSVAY